MKIQWSVYAMEDRMEIFAYLESRNPTAAVATDERIFKATRRLVRFPHSGRLGRCEGSRELVLSGTPYIACYQILPTKILILRVLHGAELWPATMPLAE